MTPPSNDNIDVNGLLTTLGAVFTLIGAILALLPLLLNRTAKVTAPFDLSINVIEIERKEIDQELWKKRKLKIIGSYIYIITFFLAEFIFIISFLMPNTFFRYQTIEEQVIYLLLGILYFIIIITIPLSPVYYLRPFFELRFHDAKQARFYIFQTVNISVQGDIDYLFGKAREALQGKRGQNIDVDFNERKLETCLKWGFKKSPAKVIVEFNEINPGCYSLTINYEKREININKLISYDVFRLVGDQSLSNNLYDIDASSAFINQFINKLLTKQA